MPRNRFYQGPVSDHFDGQRFHAPVEPPKNSLLQLAWMNTVKAARFWPVVTPPAKFDVPPRRIRHLRIGPIGHASVLVQVDGSNLLIDPVYAPRLGPVPNTGPKRQHRLKFEPELPSPSPRKTTLGHKFANSYLIHRPHLLNKQSDLPRARSPLQPGS